MWVCRDLVGALAAEHALGRLLVFDIPHARMAVSCCCSGVVMVLAALLLQHWRVRLRCRRCQRRATVPAAATDCPIILSCIALLDMWMWGVGEGSWSLTVSPVSDCIPAAPVWVSCRLSGSASRPWISTWSTACA